MAKTFFDMTQCKPGDKLISKHGMILTYEGPNPYVGSAEFYPHLVKYPNGSHGTRCDDGMVASKVSYEGDHDIVGFALNIIQHEKTI